MSSRADDDDGTVAKLKVCVFSELFLPFIGGGQIHLYELSRSLARRGVEVHIVTNRYGRSPEHEHLQGFQVHRVGFPWKRKRALRAAGYLVSSWKKAAEINHHGRFDLVHSHVYLGPLSGLLTSLSLRLPHVVTVHGVYSDVYGEIYPRLTQLLPRVIERSLLNLPYTRMICVSKMLSNQLASMGIPTDRLSVIPNGVDLERFNPNVESRLKNDLKIEDCFLVSFFGRLWPVKGLEFLIRAIHQVVRETEKVKFLIVGDGPQRPYLLELVRELGVEDFVIFHGSIPSSLMPQYLRGSDVVVLPSLMEGSSLLSLEAMACEVPVVATSVGGLPEIVRHMETGVSVEPRSSRQLAEGIISILTDDALREKVISNGLDLVKNHHSWESIAEKTLQLYSSILSEG